MLWDSILPDSLDWTVELKPIFNAAGVPIPRKREIVRLDTGAHLGIVGADYAPLQNHECAAFLQTLTDCVVEKAGVFGDGCKVWWVLRLPGEIRIGNDTLQKYSVMINAHDGTLGFRWFITPIRPWCSNMISMLIKSKMDYSISARHTRNINARVTEASRVFAKVEEAYATLQAAYLELSNRIFPDDQVLNYVEACLRPRDATNKRYREACERIAINYQSDPCRGSAWGVLNAVTEYLDHQRPMRGSGQAERRFSNAFLGTTAALKQRAYDMITGDSLNGPNYLSYLRSRAEEISVDASLEEAVD